MYWYDQKLTGGARLIYHIRKINRKFKKKIGINVYEKPVKALHNESSITVIIDSSNYKNDLYTRIISI